MKIKKKYLAAGSALVLSLSLCIYALNQHQVEGNKENNRVSYVDGKQDSQKTENQTPDQVSKKEDIQAEQIVVKITDQGYVTSHGDHFHYYNGKVPFDAIFSEELLMKDANYQLKDTDIVKSKVATLSRWMASIMSTLKMQLMLIIFVRRTKLSAKNKVILMMHQLLTVQWRLLNHKVAILPMMATSLIHLIL